MPRFAPVCPIQILERLGENAGRYHLPLAHDVMQSGKSDRFHDFFSKLRIHDDTVIIMDNSVIELGESVDVQWLVNACAVACATHIVLPDSLLDGRITVDLAIQAARVVESLQSDLKICVVPQGKTLAEWLWCAEQLNKEVNVHLWGCPRNFEHRLGSRFVAARLLSIIAPGTPIHMLGFSDYLHYDMINCRHPNVLGIDSAVPIRMGQMNIDLGLGTPIPPRGDWWESVNDDTELNDKVITNIQRVLGWINAEDDKP